MAFLAVIFLAAWALTAPAVSPAAVDAAKEALRNELGLLPDDATLMVVDFTRASFRKRLLVMDLQSGDRKYHLVAHGRNSGRLFATEFSNEVGSRMSSLGLYRVTDQYQGRHGLSLRLTGLSKSLNQNAEKRGIVIHSAEYVSMRSMLMNAVDGFRIGRSEGCFALGKQGFAAVYESLRPQAFLFAYGGSQ